MMADLLLDASVVSHLFAVVERSASTVVPAYLDPGTGSLIIQMLIGTLVGGAVAARVFWKRGAQRFRTLFRGGSRNDTPED